MLGYSSVMHMGYIFLGISSLNLIGLSGAAMMMFAHGLSIAVLFAVAGEVRARTGTMRLDELGGLASSMPFLTLDLRAGDVCLHRPAGLRQLRLRDDGVLRRVLQRVRRRCHHVQAARLQRRHPDRHDLRAVGRRHVGRLHAARVPPGVPRRRRELAPTHVPPGRGGPVTVGDLRRQPALGAGVADGRAGDRRLPAGPAGEPASEPSL